MFVTTESDSFHLMANGFNIRHQCPHVYLLTCSSYAELRHADKVFKIDFIVSISHAVEVCGDLLDVISHTGTGIQHKDNIDFIQFSRCSDVVTDFA